MFALVLAALCSACCVWIGYLERALNSAAQPYTRAGVWIGAIIMGGLVWGLTETGRWWGIGFALFLAFGMARLVQDRRTAVKVMKRRKDASITLSSAHSGAVVDLGKELASLQRLGKGSAGQSGAFLSRPVLDYIMFTYRDKNGNTTKRGIHVHAVDGEYLEGYCDDAQAQRTFRLGRVVGKVMSVETGEVFPPKQWAAAMRRHPSNTGVIEFAD